MTAQDRFFLDTTAHTRAAARPPTPERPTSHDALFWAQATAITQSAAVGAGLFMGLWPDNPANASWPHLALPLIAAPLTAGALGFLWHHTLPICANAAPLRKHILAVSLGVTLTAVGIGTSGANLAGLLGGESARQAHEQGSIKALRHEIETVKSNAAIEAPLLADVEHLPVALQSSAAAEDNRSVVRKTKGGKGTTYNSLVDASGNCREVAASMREQTANRERLLKAAETALGEARRASEASESDKFEDAYGRAATALSSADKIHLSATASALGRGLALDRASAPFVAATFGEIERVRQQVNEGWQPVAVPTFERISEREAVRRYPNAAFLPWLIAVLVESLAAIWMPLLLALWRSDDDEPPASAAWPVPVYSPQRGPTLAAAE